MEPSVGLSPDGEVATMHAVLDQVPYLVVDWRGLEAYGVMLNPVSDKAIVLRSNPWTRDRALESGEHGLRVLKICFDEFKSGSTVSSAFVLLMNNPLARPTSEVEGYLAALYAEERYVHVRFLRRVE